MEKVERIQDLTGSTERDALTVVEFLSEAVSDEIERAEVALYNLGLSERAATRVAKGVATRVAKSY